MVARLNGQAFRMIKGDCHLSAPKIGEGEATIDSSSSPMASWSIQQSGTVKCITREGKKADYASLFAKQYNFGCKDATEGRREAGPSGVRPAPADGPQELRMTQLLL
jgi:hypothetical protein